MSSGIDFGRLFDWSMVEPENDIAIVIETRSGHRYGLVCIAREDGKGAGSVKGHTTDGAGVDIVLV